MADTLIFDHTFTGTTSVGPPGSTQGGGTSANGSDGNWTDTLGNAVAIVSSQLRLYSIGDNSVVSSAVRPLSEAALDQRIVLYANTNFSASRALLRFQPGLTATPSQAYECYWVFGVGLRIVTPSGNQTVNTLTLSGTNDYKIDFSCRGVNPTVVTATMTDITSGNTQTVTQNDSTAGLQVPGLMAVTGYASIAAGQYISYKRIQGYYDATVTGPSGAVTVGRPYVTGATGTTVSLAIPPATGGAPPYLYTWYRSTSSGFTPPGTGTSIGTGQTLTASLPDALNRYYFKCRVTDSAGTPLSVVSAQTSTPPSAAPYSATILFIGDSITWGAPGNTSQGTLPQAGNAYAMAYACQMLQSVYGIRRVAYIDQAQSATATGGWQPGGTYYNRAVAAAGSPTLTPYVHIMFGTNDAQTPTLVSKATYKTNLNNIVSGLVGLGYKVILAAPPYIDGPRAAASYSTLWDDTSNNALIGYAAAITELVTAYGISNPGMVFQGDLASYDWFRAHPELLSDGVHPVPPFGTNTLGLLWAQAIAKNVFRLTPNTGGSSRKLQ